MKLAKRIDYGPSVPHNRSRRVLFRLSLNFRNMLHHDMLPPDDYDSIILVKVPQTVELDLIPFLCIIVHKDRLALRRQGYCEEFQINGFPSGRMVYITDT